MRRFAGPILLAALLAGLGAAQLHAGGAAFARFKVSMSLPGRWSVDEERADAKRLRVSYNDSKDEAYVLLVADYGVVEHYKMFYADAHEWVEKRMVKLILRQYGGRGSSSYTIAKKEKVPVKLGSGEDAILYSFQLDFNDTRRNVNIVSFMHPDERGPWYYLRISNNNSAVDLGPATSEILARTSLNQ